MSYPDLPRLTTHVAAEDFRPPADVIYMHGFNHESRSSHITLWRGEVPNAEFVEVAPLGAGEAMMHTTNLQSKMSLRSRSSMQQSLQMTSGRQTYLDVTGIPHHVWAPIIRILIENGNPSSLHVIYAEPATYDKAPNAHAGLYELSERLNGIAPLPMFARLRSGSSDSIVIAMLGFEGSRFRHLLSALEPPDERVIPLIGVPGFQHTYPAYSFLGNRHVLEESFRFSRVQFAKSNCAFDASLQLLQIARDNPSRTLQIAPIGTKPHALAAILFAIANPDNSEIVYDHPIRRPDRTVGTGRLCIYPLDGFVEALRL